MKTTTLIAAVLTLLTSTYAQSCFFTDGSLSPNDVPCKSTSSGEVSMCCAADEYCFSNGLCISPTTNTFNRGSCTDQTWGSGCVQYCKNELFAGLYPCGGTNMSCKPGDCSNVFSVPGGEAIWNNQLRNDLGAASSSPTSIVLQVTASRTVTVSITASSSASDVQPTPSQTVIASITASSGSDVMHVTSSSTTMATTSAQTKCTSALGAEMNGRNKGVSPGLVAVVGACIALPLVSALAWALFLLKREQKRNRGMDLMHHRPVGIAEMYQQQEYSPAGSFRSDDKYPCSTPLFGGGSGQQRNGPVELGKSSGVYAVELGGST